MKDESTRVLNASAGGQQVMNDNAAIWNGKQAVVNKKAALDAKIIEIGGFDDGETDGSGITKAKTAAKEAAAQTAWKIAGPLTVFAKDTGNSALEAEIDFEWSELRYGKEKDAMDAWKLIYDRALANEAQLVAEGYVDAGVVAQLLTDRNNFDTNRGKPKAKRTDNKDFNAKIDTGIKELQVIKTDLLKLLAQFAKTESHFYNSVKAAFEKDMTGIRHIALRVRFTDKGTGVRLKGVLGEIKELGLKKISSARGVIDFSFQELEQGNYIFISKKVNYKDVSKENVKVENGKYGILEIVMEKGAGTGTETGTVGGMVKLAGMPYKGANVSIAAFGISTTSDVNGNFILNDVPAGMQTVNAELMPPTPGVPQSKQVDVKGGETNGVNFDF